MLAHQLVQHDYVRCGQITVLSLPVVVFAGRQDIISDLRTEMRLFLAMITPWSEYWPCEISESNDQEFQISCFKQMLSVAAAESVA